MSDFDSDINNNKSKGKGKEHDSFLVLKRKSFILMISLVSVLSASLIAVGPISSYLSYLYPAKAQVVRPTGHKDTICTPSGSGGFDCFVDPTPPSNGAAQTCVTDPVAGTICGRSLPSSSSNSPTLVCDEQCMASVTKEAEQSVLEGASEQAVLNEIDAFLHAFAEEALHAPSAAASGFAFLLGPQIEHLVFPLSNFPGGECMPGTTFVEGKGCVCQFSPSCRICPINEIYLQGYGCVEQIPPECEIVATESGVGIQCPSCPPGQFRMNGVCTCPSGQPPISGSCAPTQCNPSFPTATCPSGQICSSSGSCVAQCSALNPTGGCPPGQICSNGGICTACSPGLSKCGNVCSNLQIDEQNCGTCGNACPSGQTCQSGSCGNVNTCSPSNPTGTCPSGQICNSSGQCVVNECPPGNPGQTCPAGYSCPSEPVPGLPEGFLFECFNGITDLCPTGTHPITCFSPSFAYQNACVPNNCQTSDSLTCQISCS